jgi:NADPH-dependent 2,4-dienoyl-CoA reductase/sulfur reductase-like enzyme
VGAGPAGVRAAETLVVAGVRPIVIDEAPAAGGQIYRRPPKGFHRNHTELYGTDAGKARAIHETFAALLPYIDYRLESLAWNLRGNRLHVVGGGVSTAIEFDALLLATGATDRLLPIAGWTLPGCYSMGGAQIALKAQACGIGARPVFLGTGPLLYLVAYQYLKAGLAPAALLDTAPRGAQTRAANHLAARPRLAARGIAMQARLRLAGVPIETGVSPVAILGDAEVAGVRYRDHAGAEWTIRCDAVGLGFHLRSETQLADLAGCDFRLDSATGQWRPTLDAEGRTSRPDVYMAGDGANILGADAAEAAGRLAALVILADMGRDAESGQRAVLRRKLRRMGRFKRGLDIAFPWPAALARQVADDVILCRCESITAGQLREAASDKDAPELNRAKALSRIGMGRCQGRYCASAAAEILAQARGADLAAVGRLRGQAPVKPLSLATVGDA